MAPARTLLVNPNTSDIIAATITAPLHLWHGDDELAAQAVSKKSLWGADRWILDNPLPGSSAHSSTFDWNQKLPDGTNLLDQENSNLIDWLRRLVWSAIASPGDGTSMGPSSVGTFCYGIRYWLEWLVGRGLRWPAEIDKVVVDAFIEHLQEDSGDDEDEGLTEASAYMRLWPFLVLWRQRHALERAGIAPMPSPPFGGEGIVKLSKRISAIASGCYRPLPDEVAIRVLNKAMEMLGVPAADVLALSEACSAAYASASSEGAAKERQSDAAKAFRFSKVNGRVWQAPLNPEMWKPSTVKAVEAKLRRYLTVCRADWETKLVLSPCGAKLASESTLPNFCIVGQHYVDVRKIGMEIGLQVGQEQILTGDKRIHALLLKVALEHGFEPVPFINPIQRVRQLILAIQSACHIVIQATTGMRISEICALKCGFDSKKGLPRSVEVQEGVSGLTELFIVTSNLTKTEHGTPRAVSWVLGYRPKGSTNLPPAVQAMIILDKLFSAPRALSGTDSLFVNVTVRRGTPKDSKDVKPCTSIYLRQGLKQFIAKWVNLYNLPDNAEKKTCDNELVEYRKTNGAIIKTHQMRKCFGYFAANIDRRLLPVLQMNFHHVSAAMTDGAYTGNPIIERDINDVRYQNSVFELLEIARGSRGMTGRYGDQLERKIIDELRPRIEGQSTEKAYAEAFAYVAESGVNEMFFTPFGDCGANNVGASSMACHEVAGSVNLARWEQRLTPNWQTRRPSLCAGCACFVLSRRHRPYWEQRYIDNATMLGVFDALALNGPLVDGAVNLTAANVDQALTISLKLGAEREDLRRRVHNEIEAKLNAL